MRLGPMTKPRLIPRIWEPGFSIKAIVIFKFFSFLIWARLECMLHP